MGQFILGLPIWRIDKVKIEWDHKSYICPKVTKMGSKIGHRIDYNGVGAVRGQQDISSKN